jgi:TfoX/Sxy family transcriptional regulator of competence genes
MAYDLKLAARLDEALRQRPGFEPRAMFGSIGWFVGGNMCVGTWKDSLVVRCSPAEWPQHLQEPHVAEFDITGRSMKGWLLVKAPAITTGAKLARWLKVGENFVRTLPAKTAKAKKERR